MHGHLVTVEIRIERGTYQWMQLNRLTLYQNRLKCLDTQPVQCGGAVQHNRMLFDNFLQNIPHFCLQTLHHLLRALDIVRNSLCYQLLHNEWLKQLNSHLFRQAALINLQLRTYHNNGTPRIVYTFPQKVLTEASRLTFQHVRQGLQRPVSRSRNRTSPAAIINQCVYCLLQHTFLIAHDDFRRAQLQQPFQAVVPVNNPSIQIIQI